MIRRCMNCMHWKERDNTNNKDKTGLCSKQPLYFCFTLEPNVYAITKEFYLCEAHEFRNEADLAAKCQTVNLKDALKKKEDIL